jgi:imidazolonepropionase-like amidohydrolase
MRDEKFIHAGWLIDGSGEPILKNVLLTITNGSIADIDNFDNSTVPDPALVTDLSHCTIIPPLVDSHVHLALSSTVDEHSRKQQLAAGYAEVRDLIAQNIHSHFTHGVLAVRDAGDRHGHAIRYITEHSGTNREPVILKTAGNAWHKQGRYGSMLGKHPGESEPLVDAVARETGQADFIKIINSGPNSLDEFGRETPPQFDHNELKKMVLVAKQQKKKVMVHANGELPVQQALEAGCHSIEHGFFMGRENLERMAEKQTVWVPTAYAMKACSEKIEKEDIHFEKGVAAKTLQHQLEQISRARELGVTIALGTDAGSKGVLHGESVVDEMKLLIKAGYSLPEAIQCATYNGAKLLGIENEIGLIAKGQPANFLVARGTPAQLPRKLSYLEAIYLSGRPCNKDFFRKI